MAEDLTQNRSRSWTVRSLSRLGDNTLERTSTILTIGKLKLRGKEDDLPEDWWFASTAIPLLAATIGPLANVLSIAALVTKWRAALPNNGQLPEGTDVAGVGIPDPHWELVLNAISLAFGFIGNLCLLFNFTRRIRYIVALPMTIIAWYIATGILIGIVVAMNNHAAPIRPGQTWSQGFWHAIIAAALYLIGSMILMINMLGYFLGHYPQHFELDDDQRTLILQTMMFFFWLAGGAAVFSKVCGFSYADALYFCNVTVLTIGFGDIVATNDPGRGIVFPYSVIGIIFLGLMINSIRKFASGMSKDNIIRKHQLHERERTFGRSVTSEKELRDRLGLPPRKESVSSGDRPPSARNGSIVTSLMARRTSLDQYGRFDINGRTIKFHEHKHHGGGRGGAGRTSAPLSRDAKMQQRKERTAHAKRAERRQKLIVLKEEKDRFEAMREIQANTKRFKQYYALAMSVLAFGILWCIGALVFWFAEHRIQQLSYFEALYFCYVSLLTIGYGDFSPKSNAGKPFFVLWSLVAIPTMTILISDMGDTVVAAINRGTFTLADWTVMPKAGVWRDFLDNHPKLRDWLERKTKEREAKKRLEIGFGLQNPDDETAVGNDDDTIKSTLEKLAEEPPESTEHDLARKLAIAIKKTANDLRAPHQKRYSYEEWAEFTRLIRFSAKKPEEVEEEEEEEGLLEWDWIGEDSPMLADVSEAEWVLDRLCESLNRYTKKQARDSQQQITKTKGPQKVDIDGDRDYSPSRPSYHQRINTYPAHPGPRHPSASHDKSHDIVTNDDHVSPVLSRGSSGVEVVTLHRNYGKDATAAGDPSKESALEAGAAKVRTNSRDLDGAGRSKEEVEDMDSVLQRELSSHEVRDWAKRAGGEVEPPSASSSSEGKQKPQWEWMHLGGG